MNFVTVYNKLEKPIVVLVDGKNIVLNQQSSNVFPRAIADLFVAKFGDLVEVVDLSTVLPEKKKEKKTEMWFANVSGDPDAPDMVEEKYADKDGSKQTRMIKHPYKQPRAWKEEMKGSMLFNPSNPEQFRWGSPDLDPADINWSSADNETVPPMKVYEVFEIPAYKIAKFSETVGSWIQRRNFSSSNQELGLSHLIESREPPEFRPDLGWSLDDIRYWLTLARPEFDQEKGKPKLGATEAELKAKHGSKGADELAQVIFEEKQSLLTRVFFAIADVSVILPTREEFDAFKQYKDSKKTSKSDTIPA